MRTGGMVIGLALAVASCAGESRAQLVVFGAASLTDVLEEAERRFEVSQPEVDVILNLGGSNSLREQLRSGAEADVFLPADRAILRDAIAAGDATGTPVEVARNELVIAVPLGNPGGLQGLDDFSNADLVLGVCANSVPCGSLARAALDSAAVTPQIDTDEPDVRSLLGKVAGGELDGGIVYASDVASTTAVDSIAIPVEHQQVNTYAVAPTSSVSNPALAEEFVLFLLSDEGQAIFADFGFGEAIS